MDTDFKFTKESHRARNGVGIDFIGYYPRKWGLGSIYHWFILFSDGHSNNYNSDGRSSSMAFGDQYDLVPITPACPFSPETHVRADGEEIESVEAVGYGPHNWKVEFANVDYAHYKSDGTGNGLEPHQYIITRAEYAARKAAEPFTVRELQAKIDRYEKILNKIAYNFPGRLTKTQAFDLLGDSIISARQALERENAMLKAQVERYAEEAAGADL